MGRGKHIFHFDTCSTFICSDELHPLKATPIVSHSPMSTLKSQTTLHTPVCQLHRSRKNPWFNSQSDHPFPQSLQGERIVFYFVGIQGCGPRRRRRRRRIVTVTTGAVFAGHFISRTRLESYRESYGRGAPIWFWLLVIFIFLGKPELELRSRRGSNEWRRAAACLVGGRARASNWQSNMGIIGVCNPCCSCATDNAQFLVISPPPLLTPHPERLHT